MDRTADRFKIYSDFMKSLGIVQKDHKGYNNWQYEYKPGDSFWIADLQNDNDEHRFKARVYDFYWKFDGELTAEDLYDEEGESLVEYDTKNFSEFKKLIKEKLAELNQYDYIIKQHIEKDRLNKLSKDF
jgi:hypothetical protein